MKGAQEALRELMAIYHCPPDPHDADHHHRNVLRALVAEDAG